MSTSNYEIGIVDTRAVLKILTSMGYDFRDYALTAFKRRLEHVIALHGLKNADGLMGKLNSQPEFIDQFIHDITPSTTEMFRDPSFWRVLRDEVLPEVFKGSSQPKIWLAALDSGEELYSLAIILKEQNLLDKVQLYANYSSEKTLARVKAGTLDMRNIETNEANYLRLNGKSTIHSYLSTTASHAFDPSLVEGVNFIFQKTTITEAPSAVRLALFRNRMIYQNHFLQEKTLQMLTNSLVAGGFLALGVKETLENTNTSNKFTVFNDNEKLYKRKT